MSSSYSAKDITVLEGLEPVRKRPGMYIGGVDTNGLHHLLWEIVDNSVDEAMNGHADKIAVILQERIKVLVPDPTIQYTVLGIVNALGVIIAVIVQPTIGTISDYTISRFGRRIHMGRTS